MHILLISIDRLLLDPSAASAKRQIQYFQNHPTTILLLSAGAPQDVRLSEWVRVVSPGGASKFITLFHCIRQLWRWRKTDFICDVVSTQDAIYSGWLGFFFARWRKIPIVVQAHGDYLDHPDWIKQRKIFVILNPLGKWLLRHVSAVRCVSQRIRKQVIEQFRVPADCVVAFPICTDLSTFSDRGEKVSTPNPTILFVGRLIDEKSPLLFCDTVIPLMRDDAGVQIAIAGQGDLRPEMEARFETAGVKDRVKFLGQLGPADLAKWYRSVYCLIHTAAWEGWGMPMIEAMACGCPVITTDSGCAGEAIRDRENGMVVQVRDRDALEKATRILLQDASLRETLSRAAIAEARRWDFSAHVRDQVNLYERLVQTKS